MNVINETDFRRVDLNLLLVFSALMRERNVTRAAERLFLGQPAVSAALKRLREVFADELFVRTPRGMEPTARALELANQLAPVMQTLHSALFRPSAFDPGTAQKTFRVGITDALEMAFIPSLMERLRGVAPGIRLSLRATDPHRATTMVDKDEVDLAIGVYPEIPEWQRRETLFEFCFVCLFDEGSLGIKPPLTLQQYLSFPHLLTSFNGDLRGYIDDELEKMGMQRNIVMGTSHFATLPFVLKRTPTICALPQYAAYVFDQAFNLTVATVPLNLRRVPMSLLWAARMDRDPALTWLRQQLREIAKEEVAKWPELPKCPA